LKEIDLKVIEYFQPSAEQFLEECNGDGLKALSLAFAMICNTTKPLPFRSLISSDEGVVTLVFRVDKEIRNVGYIKSMTQKQFPGLTYSDTVTWRLCADLKGVVVDVLQEKIDIKKNEATGEEYIVLAGVVWKDVRGISLNVCKELPELQERANYGDQSLNSGRGRFGNSRGSAGNFRRGGGRGRVGHRGGY
jgi:ATP-dependent RNA helicase DDX21